MKSMDFVVRAKLLAENGESAYFSIMKRDFDIFFNRLSFLVFDATDIDLGIYKLIIKK